MKNRKLSALLNTPLGVVIVVGAVVFGTELLLMLLIGAILEPEFQLSVSILDLLDAIILTAVVASVLYFLVFRRIQEAEKRFRQINFTAQDAIVIVNEQAQVTDWNFAAQKMFQYSREEMLGQQIHQLIAPPRYHADAVRGFALFQETGVGPLIGKTNEISALRKDGSEFAIELSISVVKVKRGWHTMGIIRDITNRKQAEARLAEQLNELRRWHDATSGREGRILDLKHEVNELLVQAGQPPRYPSAESEHQT